MSTTLNYYLSHLNDLIEHEPEIVSTTFKLFSFKFGNMKLNEFVVSDIFKYIELSLNDIHKIGFKFKIENKLNIYSFKVVSYLSFGIEHDDRKIIYSSDKRDIVGQTYDLNIEEKLLKILSPIFDEFIKIIEFNIQESKKALQLI